MPIRPEAHSLSPDERRREIAAILAAGVQRLRRKASPREITPSQETQNLLENALELSGKTRLSVSVDTLGLPGPMEGDDA